LLLQQRFDVLVFLLEALERRQDRRAIGREIGRAVVGHDGDAVLRQQPLANEPDRGVDPLVGRLEATAAEDEQKDALIQGGQGCVGRQRLAQRRSAGPRWLRRQRVGLEQANFLPDPVLLDGEIFLFEVGDGIAVGIDDTDVDRHQGRPAPDSRRCLLRQ